MARSATRDAVLQSRSDDIKQRFTTAAGDHAATNRVTNDVLNRRQRTHHADDESARLTKDFSAFFTRKLTRIRRTIASSRRTARRFTFSSVPFSGPTVDEFTIDEARKVIMGKAVKSAPLDIGYYHHT